MPKRFMSVCSTFASEVRFVPLTLLLLCFGCGGSPSNKQTITTPPPPQLPPPTPGIESSYNFGMQCGLGNTQDCKSTTGGAIVWPQTQAQPGMLRLHDSETAWARIEPISAGVYNWTAVNEWLDTIAVHEPVAVIQVFSWVPCWDAPTCLAPLVVPTGTNVPPSDLTTAGSPSFNTFVAAFVKHCSPSGNCVKDIIKYYEMWNEWDTSRHWTGNMAQLYEMVAPAVSIIRQNVPNAFILTPSVTGGGQAELQNWLNYENANGRISDWVAWHSYLISNSLPISPEDKWSGSNANFLSIQTSTAGWAKAPWANTETNFDDTDYLCSATQYTLDDCTGQVVRWQILHDSNGASDLSWFKWNETIGLVPQYETAYYNMMQYTIGGHYAGAASFTAGGGASTWTAPFVTASGGNALWVWTPNESGTITFTVPSGYADYRDLSGNKTSVTAGQAITIGPEPFFLEQ